MHALALFTLSAYAGLTTALFLSIPHNHVQNQSSTDHKILNAAQPLLGAWPPTPFVHSITRNAFINITRYGRRVCSDDYDCETQVHADMNGIGWKIIFDYEPAAEHAYSFTSGDVNLYIKQYMATETGVVLKILHALTNLTDQYGTTEVVGAALVNGMGVLARFMLTFPEL